MNSIYEQLKIDRTVPIPLYYQIKTFMINHIEDLHIFRNNFMVKEDANVYAQIPF